MLRPLTDLIETTGPMASPFGILSPAVTVVTDSSDTWIDRFTYEIPDAAASAYNRIISGGDNTVTDTVTEANAKNPFTLYYPFDVEATFKASTFGTTPEWIKLQAEAALDVVTQKAVEHEFWTGTLAKQLTVDDHNNRWLASSAAVDVTPTPGTGLRPRHAQALLEEALGEATLGSAGTLHAPRSVASVLHLQTRDKTLVTKLGNTVVAGSGYSHTGPDGSAATGQLRWMYATGPVTVLLGPATVNPGKTVQAVDTRQNTVEWYANRPAAVVWSTTNLYAVLVDLSLDYI